MSTVLILGLAVTAIAADGGPSAEVYGFVQTDAGYNAGSIHPDWFDVIRPSYLPAYEDEYGKDGQTYFSVRQTRFGVKSQLPAGDDDIETIFEWELFGVGADAGQTTLRLRHAYGQYKRFGAGQYWSVFMDIDVFPSSLEYWGPSGMAFYRNIQLRYTPLEGDNHLAISLERPGASGDRGRHNDVLQDRNLFARYPVPDLAAEYRRSGDWGYLEVAGIVRHFRWDDLSGDDLDFSGDATGWGVNLSGNLRVGPEGSVLRAAYIFGEGIQNYMNDATADIVVVEDDAGELSGAELVPVWGLTAFYDLAWNDRWSTAVGYSHLSLDYDGTAALASTFTEGRYGLLNVQHRPVDRFMYGIELQYGGRKNVADGWDYDAFRVQFSFRYSYSALIGG
jgi:hypothetical protein